MRYKIVLKKSIYETIQKHSYYKENKHVREKVFSNMTNIIKHCTFCTNREKRCLQVSDLCHVNVCIGLFHDLNS